MTSALVLNRRVRLRTVLVAAASISQGMARKRTL